MQNWMQVFKFPYFEETTYDRCECSAKNQIYPLLGNKPVGDITAADIKNLLNYWMNKGYAYTTVKKAYVVLNEYFRYLYREELIPKNPMANVEMMKKSNYLRAGHSQKIRHPSRAFEGNELRQIPSVSRSRIFRHTLFLFQISHIIIRTHSFTSLYASIIPAPAFVDNKH